MSAWTLSFSERLSYGGYDEITVEAFLSSNPTTHVAILGLDLETGVRETIRTAAGSFIVYGHNLTLTVSDIEWDTVVYFAEPENFPVNVVGRVGFPDISEEDSSITSNCFTSILMMLPDRARAKNKRPCRGQSLLKFRFN
ncbi:MAG: hypothetical protein AB1631_15400 [Acidobacteriota bacterium]